MKSLLRLACLSGLAVSSFSVAACAQEPNSDQPSAPVSEAPPAATAAATTAPSTTPETSTASSFDSKAASLESRLNALDTLDLAPIGLGLVPGLTASVPTAYSLPKGVGVVGLGYQERLRFSQTSDGGLGIVFGLTPPSSRLGFNVGASIFSLRGRSDGKSFGSRGAFNFKVSHLVGDTGAVAIGVENALKWGGNDTKTSFYGAYSQVVKLNDDFDRPFSNLYLNVGLGNGRFLKEDDFLAGDSGINIFGSATTNLAQRLNGFVEWNGQDANVGLSWVPFKNVPLVVTPAAVDLTGSAGNGTRLTLSLGYSFTF